MSNSINSKAAIGAGNLVRAYRPSLLRPRILALLWTILFLAAPPAQAEAPGYEACFAFDRAACETVLVVEPDNLTALFLRGLAAELDGDDAAALADFDEAATREPRHFGAQLWRHIAATSLGQSRAPELTAFLDQLKYKTSGRILAELYLGKATAADVLASLPTPNFNFRQPHSAESEIYCAAQYHIGRLAYLAGRVEEAREHFRLALETGSAHVFEYQAAKRALDGVQ